MAQPKKDEKQADIHNLQSILESSYQKRYEVSKKNKWKPRDKDRSSMLNKLDNVIKAAKHLQNPEAQARILYVALQEVQTQLKAEQGVFTTASRLKKIVDEDIKGLVREFPNVANPEAPKASVPEDVSPKLTHAVLDRPKVANRRQKRTNPARANVGSSKAEATVEVRNTATDPRIMGQTMSVQQPLRRTPIQSELLEVLQVKSTIQPEMGRVTVQQPEPDNKPELRNTAKDPRVTGLAGNTPVQSGKVNGQMVEIKREVPEVLQSFTMHQSVDAPQYSGKVKGQLETAALKGEVPEQKKTVRFTLSSDSISLARANAVSEQPTITRARANAVSEQPTIARARANAVSEQPTIARARANAVSEQPTIARARANAVSEQPTIARARANAVSEQPTIARARTNAVLGDPLTQLLNRGYTYTELYKGKQKNFAQTVFSKNRNPALDKLEKIRLGMRDDTLRHPAQRAETLYTALAEVKKDLASEFRWTGRLRQSRLEAIVDNDMALIRKQFPDLTHRIDEKMGIHSRVQQAVKPKKPS